MKYSVIILGSLCSAAFAAPQVSATVTQAPSVVSYSMSPQQTCLNKCDAGDVNCEAACVGVAHPNASQVNDTTQCAMNCDQGDGTPAATEKYSQCVQACISSHFPTSQTLEGAVASVASSAASNAASATGSAAASGASKTGAQATGSATGTASGAAASSSKGAASVNNVQMGAAGLAGLFMAIFAM